MSSRCAAPADRVPLGPVSSVCVDIFSSAGRLHWGNVNSLCGSLGTVFHLPSRNCSNEARHIAFHPSLPAIRHSSQFWLWPQRSVCTHRHNVVGQVCPLPSVHAAPHVPGLLHFLGLGVEQLHRGRCVSARLPRLRTNPLPKNSKEGRTLTIFANLADVECFKRSLISEEKIKRDLCFIQNQAFTPATHLTILKRTSQKRNTLPPCEHKFTFISAFHPFWYCLCRRINAVSKRRPALKPH